MAEATLHLCAPCLEASGRDAAAVAAALGAHLAAALGGRVAAVPAPCLGPCGRPLALALQGQGRAAYVFAAVDLPADTGDVAATCAAYLSAPDGWIEDAQPCGRLRTCLASRVPAPAHRDDG